MLRKQGFRSGVADYFLPVPIPTLDSAGLWIELKRQDKTVSKPSVEQLTFLHDMRHLGYYAVPAYGAESAERLITEYLAHTGCEVTVGFRADRCCAQAAAFAEAWYRRRTREGELRG